MTTGRKVFIPDLKGRKLSEYLPSPGRAQVNAGDFEEAQRCLNSEGQSADYYSTCVRAITTSMGAALSRRQMGLYRNSLLSLGQLHDEIGDFQRALTIYMETAYLDFNGPCNAVLLNGLPQAEGTVFDPEHGRQAPWVIGRIISIIKLIDLEEAEVMMRFRESARTLKSNLQAPLDITFAWERFSAFLYKETSVRLEIDARADPNYWHGYNLAIAVALDKLHSVADGRPVSVQLIADWEKSCNFALYYDGVGWPRESPFKLPLPDCSFQPYCACKLQPHYTPGFRTNTEHKIAEEEFRQILEQLPEQMRSLIESIIDGAIKSIAPNFK